MLFSDYLDAEWRPALGCTEPAAIAFAASHAANQSKGHVRAVHLTCDPRIYKNCYAVGIPNSDKKVGILWSVAIGAEIPDPSAGLQLFRQTNAPILAKAMGLLDAGAITVDVDHSKRELFIDCRVVRAEGVGRAVVEREHTRLTLLERDGKPTFKLQEESSGAAAAKSSARAELARLSLDELIALAGSATAADRARLHEGVAMNLAMARHGMALGGDRPAPDAMMRAGQLVAAAVYSRMTGEDLAVMSLAGSGNKGLTVALPLAVLSGAEEAIPTDGAERARYEEALALACVLTSAATHYLGSLSAVCGCVNAAGIGLAAAIVKLRGGDDAAIGAAVQNMVGNITGMICDGAKVGCGLKTSTGVDAAFRAAALALMGRGVTASDGIVGTTPEESLRFLSRIANEGMGAMDGQILQIMREKLRR